MINYDSLADFTLPPSAQELVDIIGINNAIKLIKRYGGCRLDVPKVVDDNQAYRDFISVLDEENTLLLMRHYRGTRIYIPRCETAMRHIRDAQFVRAVDALIVEKKVSQDRAFFELCPKFGISARTAFTIVARYNQHKIDEFNARQFNLF